MLGGIRNRILVVHAVVFAVGLLLSGLVFFHGRGVMHATTLLVEKDLPALKSLSDLKTDVVELEPILLEYYISANRSRFLVRVESNRQRIEANLKVAREAFPGSEVVAGIEAQYDEIKSLARQLDQTLSAPRLDPGRAKSLIAIIGRSCAQIIQELDGLVRAVQKNVQGRAQASHDKVYGMVGLVAFFSGMLFLVVLIAGHYVKAYLAGVAERRRAEQNLAHQAYHDALTGLPNRRRFQERLVEALSGDGEDPRPAVLILNVDRLKLVNDSLGHMVGDRLLQAVVERLGTALQGCQEMCAGSSLYRLEGDLFAILSPNTTVKGAPARLAGHISAHMKDSFEIEGREFFVTFSIGIAVSPGDGKDPITLVKNADSAMHAVKQRGGNGFQCYTQEMNARALERLELGNALGHALERGELALHYQPQLDLGSGRIIGMEALIRWRHPERGMVSPAEFIPLAEESGLIVPIGEWVLRSACAQARAWQDAGLPALTMAVNLSGRQFHSRDLPDTVERILAETGLPPENLELEVTESVAMREVEPTVAALNRLKRIGIRLSIDDFGTGYSSLAYLKRFPIDKLKVDQSFVRNLTTDANDATIARTVITLGHSLGLKVIAEGVETQEQLDFLAAADCDEIQGYLISRPVPAEDFPGVVVKNDHSRPAGFQRLGAINV